MCLGLYRVLRIQNRTIYLVASVTWDRDNAQILIWFHNSVEDRIGMMFSKYPTAKEVWEYLFGVYQQSNFAKRYELESAIQNAC